MIYLSAWYYEIRHEVGKYNRIGVAWGKAWMPFAKLADLEFLLVSERHSFYYTVQVFIVMSICVYMGGCPTSRVTGLRVNNKASQK